MLVDAKELAKEATVNICDLYSCLLLNLGETRTLGSLITVLSIFAEVPRTLVGDGQILEVVGQRRVRFAICRGFVCRGKQRRKTRLE